MPCLVLPHTDELQRPLPEFVGQIAGIGSRLVEMDGGQVESMLFPESEVLSGEAL
jgi:hypothetical protein